MGRPVGTPRRCSIDGCDRPHSCKGFCKPHYQQDWYRRHQHTPPPAPTEPAKPVAVCPDHLLPLIAEVAAIDAANLFRVAWWWCGEQALAKTKQQDVAA